MDAKNVDQTKDTGVAVSRGGQTLTFLQADSYEVDGSGYLILTRKDDVIATYAAGAWDSAMRLGLT